MWLDMSLCLKQNMIHCIEMFPDVYCSTKMAFESKLAKSSRGTDFRISAAICTMFNVMVDAKDQSAKLCAMEMGQEVRMWCKGCGFISHKGSHTPTRKCTTKIDELCVILVFQKQYHAQIDELIEESVKDMIQLMVAKVHFTLLLSYRSCPS